MIQVVGMQLGMVVIGTTIQGGGAREWLGECVLIIVSVITRDVFGLWE